MVAYPTGGFGRLFPEPMSNAPLGPTPPAPTGRRRRRDEPRDGLLDAPLTSATACPPRDVLERVTRLVAAALGRPAVLAGDGDVAAHGEASGDAGGDGVLVVRVLRRDEPWAERFRDDATAGADDDAEVPDPAARAWAIVPLPDPSGTIAAPAAATAAAVPSDSAALAPLALCVWSRAPRPWTPGDAAALREIAASLGAGLALRRELADARTAADELRRHAMRDRLTGLPKRALFLDRLEHAVERAKRHKDFRFAVLSLDLDRFKAVNDGLGRAAGDAVLVAVAQRLQTCVRGEDIVARLNSDEFAVLLESLADDSDGGRVAERLLQALGAPVATSDGEVATDVFTSASVGVVLSSSGLDAPERLLQRAGIAMTRAKAAGRARYEMFDREMHARAFERLRTETALRHALERGELELYYQPLVDLGSGRVTELEALLRWRHPERGVVPPLEFIPLAEETGLIVPIGAWVLTEACRQTRDWQRRFARETPLAVSVNLSVKQFAQPAFARTVADTLRSCGLNPCALKLEITESFAVDDADGTRGMLEELRRLGVRIYLDDFGTGYSSLGYLHRLPLDAIKIDRSFVMRMEDGPTHMQLVRTVRDLARNIGVAAVAEGVETPAQLATLRALGCESAQGYLFSRPAPAYEIEQLLVRDPRW
jgi:diguanylate cyclase (GGDEF)-like protein